jgi:signal transduction histidine kinase
VGTATRFRRGALLAALLLAQSTAALPNTGGARTIALTHAEIALDARKSVPGDAARWQAQPLPDNWGKTRPEHFGFAWYRLRFALDPAPAAPLALYLPRVSMNAEVFLNGARLGDGGRFEEPVARNSNRGFFFPLPAALLRADKNLVHLRVYGYFHSRAGVSTAYIGPEAELRERHERRYLAAVIGPLVTSAIVGAIGLYALLVWAKRRRESLYGWFGAAAIVWALRNLNHYVRDIPLPTEVWGLLAHAGHGWFFALFAMFVLRYCGLRRPWLEAAIGVFALAGPLATLVLGPEYLNRVLVWWLAPALVLVLWLALLLVRFALEHRRLIDALLCAAYAVYLALLVHDWMILDGRLPYDSIYLAHYSGLLIFFVVALQMNTRFAESLASYEALSRELERRVADKELALQAYYARETEVARAAAALEERRRIMQDMHDGVGAHLVSALRAAEHGAPAPGRVPALLRECLDDMRLAIDALDADDDLLAVLGNLRQRMAPRFAAAGIELLWRVDAALAGTLPPRTTLQVLRIVQEALANALKHSGARKVGVEVRALPGGTLELAVSDDGRGFDPQRASGGRGLANMRMRAERIGSDLEVGSSPAGSAVRLRLEAREGLAPSS